MATAARRHSVLCCAQVAWTRRQVWDVLKDAMHQVGPGLSYR